VQTRLSLARWLAPSPHGPQPEQVEEFKCLLKLGVPLALGEIGWMSTYIVDAVMIGHLPNSPLAISASSLGNSIFYAVAFAVIFLLNGLETLVAQAYGRDDKCECVLLLAQSLWLVLAGTPLTILSTLGVFALLPRFGTPPEVVAETRAYLLPLLWTAFPLLAYMSLRRFLQSCGSVLWVTASLLFASAVNWLFDWIFLFGHWGVHPMGIAGSAWSTNVVRLFMLSLLVAGTVQGFHRMGVWPTWRMLVPEKSRLRALLRIGWPSGVESLAELGTTTFLSVVCARLGPVLLAANQVLLDLTALVYQVAVGLAYAAVVRVGQNAGRNDADGVRRAAKVSLMVGCSVMLSAGILFGSFAHAWASLYTNSENVAAAAVPIFKLCSLTLLTDTVFVLLASALTGIGDTRTPMVVSLFWNWVIGMPLAFTLTSHAHLQLMGLWVGRASASIGTAVTLFLLWQRRMAASHEAASQPLSTSFERTASAHAGLKA
jgi:multidrug resistance protein, MATE family